MDMTCKLQTLARIAAVARQRAATSDGKLVAAEMELMALRSMLKLCGVKPYSLSAPLPEGVPTVEIETTHINSTALEFEAVQATG